MRPGILVARPPGRAPFRYTFTPADAVWLGRLLAGTGGQYRGRRQSLLWSVLSRFALHARGGMSLGDFVQRLAPALPRVPWQQLPRGARRLALAAVTGVLPGGAANGIVRVVPYGYAPGSASPYSHGSGSYGQGAGGYGQGGRQYGWSGEMELEDPAPVADSSKVTTAKPAPPPVAGDSPAPSDDVTGSTGAAPPDDAGAMPDAGDGGDTAPAMDDEPAPPQAAFDTQDGNRLVLNPNLMRSLMRAFRRRYPRWRSLQSPGHGYPGSSYQRYRQPGYGRMRPWAGRVATAQPWAVRRALAGRVGRLARGSRRIGTLRGVRSGRRFPVFGGRVGGRNYRIVTRPRGGLRHEIVLVRGSELQQEMSM